MKYARHAGQLRFVCRAAEAHGVKLKAHSSSQSVDTDVLLHDVWRYDGRKHVRGHKNLGKLVNVVSAMASLRV